VKRIRPVLFTAVACATLLVVACDSITGPSVPDLISRALTKLENKDVRAATIDVKTALQQEPGNAAARQLLGQISLTLGDAGTAEKELARSRELGTPADTVVPCWRALCLRKARPRRYSTST